MQRASATTTLLAGVVDYAGLFPPAALSMPAAVAEYAAALGGPDAWMLGRFVLPAARLAEWAEARAGAAAPATPWRLSAIVRDRSEEDGREVAAFNGATARHGALVDSVECRPQALEGVEWLAGAFPAALDVYVEVPPGPEAPRWIAAVKAHGLKAKVRTGGLTADAFPAAAEVLSFVAAALAAGVPFKATAGLHHAVSGRFPLTAERKAPKAPMYGYLNLLLATAALAAGLPAAVAEDLLRQTDASALVFTEDEVRWGTAVFPVPLLKATRASHLESFGSCSFREPVDELHTLTSHS